MKHSELTEHHNHTAAVSASAASEGFWSHPGVSAEGP